MERRPCIKTVAAAAGVSPSTVSNAYNRPEQLSAAVRERVLEIASEQGYAGPDPAARSLRGRRAGAIGMLFAQDLTYAFSDPYVSELLSGVAEVVTTTATNLLLMPVGPHEVSRAYSRDEELRLVTNVRQAVLDGAIADGLDATHPVLRVLADRGIPIVSADDGGDRYVTVDDHAAAAAVGRHLHDLGHRRVAVLGDSMDDGDPIVGLTDTSALFPYARQRLDGIRSAVGRDAEVVAVSAGRNTRASGRAAAAALLDTTSPLTAVAATSDVLALGVLDECAHRGITVSTTLSVTGFDDIAEAATSGLTSVRQPVRDKGRLMARMLLDPNVTETQVTLPTELVVRTSTGPPAT